MEIHALVSQNLLTKEILTNFRINSGRSYTSKEMAENQHLLNGAQQITKSIGLLVRQGLIKVKSRGSELCYQIIPAQKK